MSLRFELSILLEGKTMKKLLLLIFLIPSFASAEQFTCSYPNYTNGDTVILEIDIKGKSATVGSKFPMEYKVIENNKYGVILVYSFATENNEFPGDNDIGMFGIVIDKLQMKMVRGNIVYGDKSNNLKVGTCIK